MSELYFCTSDDRSGSLASFLESKGCVCRVEGYGNGFPIVSVSDPDEILMRHTVDMLRSERIRSAGMFRQRLKQNELYLVAEWRGKFVVESEIYGQVDFLDSLLVLENKYDPRKLSIFKIATGTAERDPHEEIHHFGSIAATPIRAAKILADPGRYYGKFAEAEIGGANALYAAGMEAARERCLPEGEVLVGDPSAFGFEIDTDQNSIVSWRRKGVISTEATGFSLGSWDAALRLYAMHGQYLDLTDVSLQAEEWRQQGFRFGVAIVLIGLQDPPVVIPMGAVFQQPSMGSSMQTLGIAKPAQVMVAAGATVPLVLPAYCLNQSFLPPNGPVAPTPLLAPAVSGPQEAVWENISRRYRGA